MFRDLTEQNTMAIAGDTVLLASIAEDGWGPQTIDLSNPRSPRSRLGSCGAVVLCSIYAVAAAGRNPVWAGWYTYCRPGYCGNNSFFIIGPRGVDPPYAGSLTANESWVISSRDHRLDLIDVATATVVGHVDTSVTGIGSIDDRHAALITEDGSLTFVDFADPSAPRIAGSLDTQAHDVVMQHSFAFVAADSELQVVDASDLDQPKVVSHLPIPALRLARSGSRLIVNRYGAFARIFDMSDPMHLQELVSVCWDEGWCRSVAANEKFVALATDYGDVQIFDISTVPGPGVVPLSEWLPVPGDRIATSQRWTAVSGGKTLSILDVSDPRTPRLLSHVSFAADITSLAAEGDFAYVVAGGLRVVDLQAPSSPRMRGTLAITGSNLSVSNGWAVCMDENFVHIVDVRDADAPHSLPDIPHTSSAWLALAYANGTAYVANHEGIHIIDLRDPAAPRMLGTVSYSAYFPFSMRLAGNTLFTTGLEMGMFDVTDPAAPKWLATFPSACVDVCVTGGHAYCAGGGRLRVLDVQDLQHPLQVGGFGVPVSACAVGEGAILGVGNRGLAAFPLQCRGPTAVAISDFAARIEGAGVLLSWRADPNAFASFAVQRQRDGAAEQGWTLLSGQPRHVDSRWEYVDDDVQPGAVYEYEIEGRTSGGELVGLGPIRVDTGRTITQLQLSVSPNPSGGVVQLFLDLPRRASLDVRVYDVSGRCVRSLAHSPRDAGRSILPWDGRDDHGNPVAPGIYFVRASWPGGDASARVARLH